jgi:2'-5' RNA ligase
MADLPDYSGSCMIALYPPARAARKLAIEGGLEASEIHCTIAYTGDAADVDADALNAAAEALASRAPLAAAISGHARFTGGEQDCIVALADGPELEQLRADARAALAGQGIGIPPEHGFTPHLAITYQDAGDADPVGRIAPFPVTFTAVSAVHGDNRTDYPFTPADDGDLETLAAEAYFAGWSLSGGPLTQRVTAGMPAAVATALEHASDPRILEVTLQIGKLEGAWALVFDRREKLIASHAARIETLWRKLCHDLDPGRMVHSFRRHAGMTIESDPWRDVHRAEASALAAGMLHGIRTGAAYEDLVTAIEAALAAGTAEGKTAALAVAAEQAGHDGFRWTAAYDHMFEPLKRIEGLPGMGDQWVQRIIDGNAADIGRALASLAAEGADYEEMAAAVAELTTGASIRAVQALIDYAMSGAAVQGSLDLYASEGVQWTDWLSAGDDRVCFTCQDNEDNSPYPPGQFPDCPNHPRCRCCPAAADPLPLSAYAQFLPAAA